MAALRIAILALIAGLGPAVAAPAAGAARPATGSYSTQAVGQARPHILIDVGREGRIMGITLERLRCMTGRIYANLGLRQRGGTFTLRRRSGAIQVGTGRLLVGTDYRMRGRFTTSTAAQGEVRFIRIRRGGRRCDSGWVRFRVAPINPIEFGGGLPLTTDVELPGTATAQIAIRNTGRVASAANRVEVTLRAFPSNATQLGVAPPPVLVADRGTCGAAAWRGGAELEASAVCDLGRLPAGASATITVSSAWPAPVVCDGGADLTLSATMQRATLNDVLAQGEGTGFRLMCAPVTG